MMIMMVLVVVVVVVMIVMIVIVVVMMGREFVFGSSNQKNTNSIAMDQLLFNNMFVVLKSFHKSIRPQKIINIVC